MQDKLGKTRQVRVGRPGSQKTAKSVQFLKRPGGRQARDSARVVSWRAHVSEARWSAHGGALLGRQSMRSALGDFSHPDC